MCGYGPGEGGEGGGLGSSAKRASRLRRDSARPVLAVPTSETRDWVEWSASGSSNVELWVLLIGLQSFVDEGDEEGRKGKIGWVAVVSGSKSATGDQGLEKGGVLE